MAERESSPVGPQVDVYAGVARLPQPSSNSVLLTVEIEIDSTDQSILAVHITPDLGGLKRIIKDAIVGEPASLIPTAGVTAIMAHYHSPFRNAARAALLHAWEAYGHVEKPFASFGDPPSRMRARFLD